MKRGKEDDVMIDLESEKVSIELENSRNLEWHPIFAHSKIIRSMIYHTKKICIDDPGWVNRKAEE